jgi:malic enzyme
MEEIAPLVYTPTVGVVCEQFGFRFTRARGMYFSAMDKGNFSTMVHNWPHDGEQATPFLTTYIPSNQQRCCAVQTSTSLW